MFNGRNLVKALAIGVILALTVPVAAWTQKAELTLLHINDVYEISPKRGKGGMAQLMTLLKQERARAANSLTTLGGDLISPSLLSGITQGAQMIELMNAIGLDLAVLGNHEFDFGDEVLLQRMKASKFTWLASNVLHKGKPFAGAPATLVRDFGGLKVGFFSALTPETSHLSSPGKHVAFTPVVEAAASSVKALKEQGAHAIIALTHLDIAQDRALARSVRGINVILGGHDHDPISFYEGGTLILKAGYDAHYLAVADLKLEMKKGRRGPKLSMQPAWRFLSTSGVTPDAGIATIVAGYEKQLDEKLNITVGKTNVELDSQRGSVRTGEAVWGNVIADAIRASVGAGASLTNGGGIRGDRIYEAGSTLTRRDVLTELPFGNVVVLLELSGADLLAALENGVARVEDKAGRFPHVSGIKFVYDPSAPKGSRIVSVSVGGKPLDNSGSYRIATNDYIAGGGDGYAALKKGKVIIGVAGGPLMATVVMDHIAAKGSITPKVEGRITTK